MNKKFPIIIGVVLAALVGSYFLLKLLFPFTFFGPLKLNIEVPLTVKVGDHSVFKLHVKNESSRVVKFNLPGDPAYGFIISQDGNDIWNSRPEIIKDIYITKTLKPSEESVFQVIWDSSISNPPPSTPGIYTIRGVLYLTDPKAQLNSERQKIELK